MATLYRFPHRPRVTAAARVAHIFEPQAELENTVRAMHRFLAFATAQTALVVLALQLITR
ncbi:MAG TPA: hypothetical protein VLC09_20935 [Polyangiaceae bacterium]|nr:hypothetical protein [Polyangiaceae bacterium]